MKKIILLLCLCFSGVVVGQTIEKSTGILYFSDKASLDAYGAPPSAYGAEFCAAGTPRLLYRWDGGAWVLSGGGDGDVTAGLNLTDNFVVIGDGGTKGVKTSSAIAIDGSQVATFENNIIASDGIEITNNLGLGINQTGTADNYFAGNVGIGTNSPDKKLTVYQDADDSGIKLYGFDDKVNTYFDIYKDDSGRTILNGQGGHLYFQRNGILQMFITESGLAVTDNKKFILGSGDDAYLIYDGSDLVINPQSSGTGDVIFEAGDVGIGTITPAAKLDVNGTFKMTGATATLGTHVIKTDQVIGATEDGYVETYDHGTGLINLEPLPVVGWADYSDLLTTVTPILVTGGAGFVTLTNDVLGDFTTEVYLPSGVSTVWNELTNRFVWTDLTLGSTVDIRLDVEIITTTNNTQIDVELELGTGVGIYTIPFVNSQNYKSTGTYRVLRYNGIYMGDANTIDNGGRFIIKSDQDIDVEVKGWYVKINKR